MSAPRNIFVHFTNASFDRTLSVGSEMIRTFHEKGCDDRAIGSVNSGGFCIAFKLAADKEIWQVGKFLDDRGFTIDMLKTGPNPFKPDAAEKTHRIFTVTYGK